MNMTFIYVVPYLEILVSILLGVITIYLSCYFIARKTSKISPIEKVRSNYDIKVKSKKLKTPKAIKALWGAGGAIAYKNLQRNKKRYRVAASSMVVSVMIFITMSSLTNYIFTGTLHQFENRDFNMSVVARGGDRDFSDSVDAIINMLEEDDEYLIIREAVTRVSRSYLNPEMIDPADTGEFLPIMSVYSIGQRGFRIFLESLGLDYEEHRNSGIFVEGRDVGFDYHNRFNVEDSVELQGEDEIININIAKHIESSTLNRFGSNYIIVSDETLDRLGANPQSISMMINASDPYFVEEEIMRLNENLWVSNFVAVQAEAERMILVVSIFLYGFIAVIITIGVTNIINTLTASLNLRKKEFAMLKAIGTTKKEFKQMINLESIFLGAKVLLIGIPLGMFFSYLIYHFMPVLEVSGISYDPNIRGIVISVIAVFVIVKLIMSYSMRRINKENIVETIRRDNV